MKKTAPVMTMGIFILLLFSSCSYYKDDKLNPPEGFSCDTTNVTFNGAILSMISSNCLRCHSNIAAIDDGSGIYLDTYEDVRSKAKAISGAINHTGGYFPMPKDAPRLDPCLRQQFEKWVDNGMPEN